ncbi:MAG: thioesterase family protein [Acidimicrobiales bacterium]
MNDAAGRLPANDQLSLDDSTADDRALFAVVDGAAHAETGGTSANRLGLTVRPTAYGRGPWDHGLLHGGPVVGLAAWATEQLGATDGMLCGRLTVELHHGVPLANLDVSASLVRASRRSKVVDVSIEHRSTVVARATAQWLVPSSGWDSNRVSAPPRPEQVADPGADDSDYPRPGFNCDAAELRYVSGSNEVSGPAVIWTRLTSPLMAGAATSPLVRIATVADLAAAAGFERGPSDEAFINVDVTLQLDRPPKGEWLALDARTHRSAGGLGHNEAVVFDDEGAFGRILQTLVEAPTQLGT